MKVVIVDYEVGNIFNLKSACNFLGYDVVLAKDPKQIAAADKVILPGVGAFEPGIQNLKKFDLFEGVKAFHKSGKPLLGVCLGMQLLFEKSFEGGEWDGLGILQGTVEKFPDPKNKEYKVTHMCWNEAKMVEAQKSPLAEKVRKVAAVDPFFYFVHSYYVNTAKENILFECNYANRNFAAGVLKDNVMAFQFHPERSGTAGLNLLKTFMEIK